MIELTIKPIYFFTIVSFAIYGFAHFSFNVGHFTAWCVIKNKKDSLSDVYKKNPISNVKTQYIKETWKDIDPSEIYKNGPPD